MKQFQSKFNSRPPPKVPEHTGGLGSLEAYVRYQAAAGDGFTGRPVQGNQPASKMCEDPDCYQLECEKVHAEAEQKRTWGPDQQIVFTSDGAAPGHNRNSNDTQPSPQRCKQGATCDKQDCTLGHPGPWTDQRVQLDPSNFQVHCKQQARCADSECSRSHRAWAWLYENKGPVGNTNGTNGEVHRAPWQKACSFETRPDGCKNARCAFGHRGPRTTPDMKLEFEARPMCAWDRECKNNRCDQAHSSPANDGSGGIGSGRQDVRGGRGRGGGSESGGGPPRGGGVPRGPRNGRDRGGGRGRGRGR